jgi:hypothetical protein
MKVHAEMYACETEDVPGGEWRVYSTWDAPVDRPSTHGFVLGNKRTAQRLVNAINAQVVFDDPVIKTDINGRTYVAASSRVMGKYANADLKRLGY